MMAGTAILEAFYQAAGQFVRPDYLAELLKAPQPRITTEIAELQHLGYSIEAHPHFGYRLLGSPDRLTADDIRARIHTRIIGSEVLVFDQTASTNDVVAHMARSRANEGLVVFAESQTKGRGRHGRVWASPRGKGLWFSILLRPKLKPSATPRLTVMASVAVARAIRKTSGLAARIKWPNDLTINGKKVAGILSELHAEDDEVLAAILGVGININCGTEDFPSNVANIATSLQLETGMAQDRAALAAEVLQALDECYASAQMNFDVIVAEWARLSTTLGKQLIVTMGARRIDGHAQALDADGALLLRRDNGQIERILGADVAVERA
jgi:BirA family biotin operon repressor/biotin-[acetyl-CoA-carboxylase] ligase